MEHETGADRVDHGEASLGEAQATDPPADPEMIRGSDAEERDDAEQPLPGDATAVDVGRTEGDTGGAPADEPTPGAPHEPTADVTEGGPGRP